MQVIKLPVAEYSSFIEPQLSKTNFITRQHAYACYGKSVRPFVCHVSRAGIVPKWMHIGPIGKLFPPPGRAFFSFFRANKIPRGTDSTGSYFFTCGWKNAIFDLRYEGRWLL